MTGDLLLAQDRGFGRRRWGVLVDYFFFPKTGELALSVSQSKKS
jgi:hypothetical protein